jgi:hypothetical protein
MGFGIIKAPHTAHAGLPSPGITLHGRGGLQMARELQEANGVRVGLGTCAVVRAASAAA